MLLHGIAGQGRAWERVEHELADSFQVLTPDLFGFGPSECPQIRL
ncbi:alpha/beta fold hydrolase [Nocardioides hankookensis]|uniref:Alpha/beta fold hydrolase n=1 Tax=Nocardioides hankookensis TaxID=443157 RepID=A0ABW1LNX5_9ACTN